MHTIDLAAFFERSQDAHKYDFGHVLVVGGSPGMVGAPFLAARAALRVGAGLVTIASSAGVVDKLEERVEEIMTLRLPDMKVEAVDIVLSFVRERKVNAVVMGPGQAMDFAGIDAELIARLGLPVVIDGGAIGAFQGKLSALKLLGSKNGQLIMTPHAGEYEKLNGTSLSDEADKRRREAADFARTHHLTLVLKGHHTLIAHPDGMIYENTTGNPGMATAGTGDVLAGVIGGLLSQGLIPSDAADFGVYLHGLAGDLAAAAKTQPGMIASDVSEFLPQALMKVRETKSFKNE